MPVKDGRIIGPVKKALVGLHHDVPKYSNPVDRYRLNESLCLRRTGISTYKALLT